MSRSGEIRSPFGDIDATSAQNGQQIGRFVLAANGFVRGAVADARDKRRINEAADAFTIAVADSRGRIGTLRPRDRRLLLGG